MLLLSVERAFVYNVKALAPNRVTFTLREFPTLVFEAQAPAYLLEDPENKGQWVCPRWAFPQSGEPRLFVIPYDRRVMLIYDTMVKQPGLGPTAVMTLLTKAGLDEMIECLEAADHAGFRALPGCKGKQGETALEALKDHFGKGKTPITEARPKAETEIIRLAKLALGRLGYKPVEAAEMVSAACSRLADKKKPLDNVETLVQESFKKA